jgi:hypothetical protein
MNRASLAFCASLLAGAIPLSGVYAQKADQTYVNVLHRWSIAYPAEWAIDSRNEALVRFVPPASLANGLLVIRASTVTFASVDEMVDLMLAAQKNSGLEVRILKRSSVFLADSLPAVEVDSEIGTTRVGRSRRIFVLLAGTAYIIDAEADRDSWPAIEPQFTRVIATFRVRRNP